MILDKRRAGVLLHLTSLPCKYGYGALNREALNFVDFLAECKLSLWQMLPIHPTHGLPHPDFLSPYQCQSVHAGNPQLIALQPLADRVIELKNRPRFKLPECSDKLINYRHECLKEAYIHFRENATTDERASLNKFQQDNIGWLKDYALFLVLKEKFEHLPWWEWETPYQDRDPQALAQIGKDCHEQVEQQCYEQFLFFQQWHQLKSYANNKGVYLIGDMPFFVAEDSVEMWAHRDYFLLNDQGRAKFFAGTDPQDDYFQQKGQCWRLPIYNWDKMAEDKFSWWIQRFNTMSRLFDMVRLTHFRGYVRSWAIPSETANPNDGSWLPARGKKMFERLKTKWQHPIPLIVDDIGVEKEKEKEKEVDAYNLWHEDFRIEGNQKRDGKKSLLSKMFGMKVLQLGFKENGLRNLHLPHHYTPTRVAYTGTHDSDTTLGWFNQLGENERFVLEYFDMRERDEVMFKLIRAVLQSPAHFAIIPFQDILILDSQARMNTPGQIEGCWQWQFRWEQLTDPMKKELSKLVEWYQR